jgi:hypothetical protein
MPIGKDSITKRVAKIDTATPTIEEVKTSEDISSVEKKNSATPAKTTSKKSSTKKTTTTTVITKIDPKTVEAVVGHKENTNFTKVQIGSDLPYYLL